MSDATKAIVRRYYEAGDRDDLDAWDEICAPDMILYPGFMEPVRGLEAIKQFTAGFHQALSDLSLRVEDMVAEGDRVAVRWTEGGRHTGPLMSPGGVIPPTNKHMVMRGISFVRVMDGKIVEERVLADIMGAMQSLGVM